MKSGLVRSSYFRVALSTSMWMIRHVSSGQAIRHHQYSWTYECSPASATTLSSRAWERTWAAVSIQPALSSGGTDARSSRASSVLMTELPPTSGRHFCATSQGRHWSAQPATTRRASTPRTLGFRGVMARARPTEESASSGSISRPIQVW